MAIRMIDFDAIPIRISIHFIMIFATAISIIQFLHAIFYRFPVLTETLTQITECSCCVIFATILLLFLPPAGDID